MKTGPPRAMMNPPRGTKLLRRFVMGTVNIDNLLDKGYTIDFDHERTHAEAYKPSVVTVEEKPKRKGRPKGSKNKVKKP